MGMSNCTNTILTVIMFWVDALFIGVVAVGLFILFKFGCKHFAYMVDEKDRERDRKRMKKSKHKKPGEEQAEAERTRRIMEELEKELNKA
uniref:Small integral membrane protein 15 n=1 Tax=Panagrellus redivivus TaxID=6233 RepID=A0A7E4UYK8_PANRE